MAPEEILDERLEVLAARAGKRVRAPGLDEEAGELAGRLEVGPDRLGAEVGRAEVTGERSDVALEPRCDTMCGACQGPGHR